jgi:hypothetical protein
VVTSVQLSADQGKTWKPAELDAPSRYEWVRWSSAVELTPTGAFELVCSATDETGATQPSQRENNRLDGYANNWYHRIRLTVI